MQSSVLNKAQQVHFLSVQHLKTYAGVWWIRALCSKAFLNSILCSRYFSRTSTLKTLHSFYSMYSFLSFYNKLSAEGVPFSEVIQHVIETKQNRSQYKYKLLPEEGFRHWRGRYLLFAWIKLTSKHLFPHAELEHEVHRPLCPSLLPCLSVSMHTYIYNNATQW